MGGPQAPELAPGMDVGGFTVERLLGWGACGWVYLARRGDARFALKLQPLAVMGGWARREAQILTRLEHPHVVRFQACGLYPEAAPRWFYLAMEYVAGRTLEAWVREENPGARRVAALLEDMARGLAALHAVGVLHRDLKEVNVAVREATGQAVLLDLGVGIYPGAPPLTEGVLPPGTARYRSPEAHAFQLRHGAEQDARYRATQADDLYALGVILYWMLTATWPMAAVDTPTEARVVLSRLPAAPHALNPRVPWALGALCVELLAREPGGRPASARDVLARLEAMRAGMDEHWDVPLCLEHDEPGPPPPPPDPEREEEDWLEHGGAPPGPPRRGKKPPPRPGGAASLSLSPAPPTRAEVARGPGPREAAPASREAGARETASREGAPAPHHEEVARAPEPGVPADPAAARKAPEAWWRWPRMAAVALVLAGLVAAGWWMGGEMARPTRVVESPPAVVPPPALHSTAAVPTTASPEQKASPMKRHETPPPEKPQPPKAGRPLARAATTAALTACLGCASAPEVRDLPRLPCPAGAAEAMKKLGIAVGATDDATFADPEEPSGYITVRPGEVRVRVLAGWPMKSLNGQTLSGQLYLGERVYGLFTTGFTRDGTPFPVCMELYDKDGRRGVPRKDASSSADTARIFTEVYVRAVDHSR